MKAHPRNTGACALTHAHTCTHSPMEAHPWTSRKAHTGPPSWPAHLSTVWPHFWWFFQTQSLGDSFYYARAWHCLLLPRVQLCNKVLLGSLKLGLYLSLRKPHPLHEQLFNVHLRLEVLLLLPGKWKCQECPTPLVNTTYIFRKQNGFFSNLLQKGYNQFAYS